MFSKNFSNFAPYPTTIENIVWPTIEHYYQAQKTTNVAHQNLIRLQKTPGRAKRLGRSITLRPDWEHIKYQVMYTAVQAKIEQHPLLKTELLRTGNEEIVEANTWHDNFWGACTCKRCKNITGQNYLGKILMDLRSYYQQQITLETLVAKVITYKQEFDQVQKDIPDMFTIDEWFTMIRKHYEEKTT